MTGYPVKFQQRYSLHKEASLRNPPKASEILRNRVRGKIFTEKNFRPAHTEISILIRLRVQLIGSTQVRSHGGGGEFGGNCPQILLATQNFVATRKWLIKHVIKTKFCPPNNVFPPTLKPAYGLGSTTVWRAFPTGKRNTPIVQKPRGRKKRRVRSF